MEREFISVSVTAKVKHVVKIVIGPTQQFVYKDYCGDFVQGPFHGLQLILNVQQYETAPFSDQASGVKVRWSFVIYKSVVYDY